MSWSGPETIPTGDRGPIITWVLSFALGITTVAVLLRFYVRLVMQRRFMADDYIMLFSQSNFIVLCTCMYKQIHYGMGKHVMAIFMENPMNVMYASKWWYIGQSFVLSSSCSVKIAVCIFFCSLRPAPWLRQICIGTVILSTMSGIGTMLFQLFQCWPVQYFWERSSPGAVGSCLEPAKAFPGIVTFNTCDLLTDVILAILPCYLVSTLQMSKSRKFGLGVLLGMGILCAITPFIRSFYLKPLVFDSTDFTFTSMPVTITLITEPSIAITVVCLAQLRPMMKMLMPKIWSSTGKSSGQKRTPLRTFGQESYRKKNSTIGMSDYEMTLKSKDYETNSGIHGSKMDSIDLEYGSRVNIVPPKEYS